MYHRRRAVSLALTAVLAVAGCTEADNGNNPLAGVDLATSAPATTTTAPAAAPTTAAPTTPVGGPQSTAPAKAGKKINLEAKDNEFVPKEITAPAGTINIVMR